MFCSKGTVHGLHSFPSLSLSLQERKAPVSPPQASQGLAVRTAKHKESIVHHVGFCGHQEGQAKQGGTRSLHHGVRQTPLKLHQSHRMWYSTQLQAFSNDVVGEGERIDHVCAMSAKASSCTCAMYGLNATHGPCASAVHGGIPLDFFHGKVRRRDLWQGRLFATSQCATHPMTCRTGSSCSPSTAVAMASSRLYRGQSTTLCGPQQMRQRRGRVLLDTEFELGPLLLALGRACSECPSSQGIRGGVGLPGPHAPFAEPPPPFPQLLTDGKLHEQIRPAGFLNVISEQTRFRPRPVGH